MHKEKKDIYAVELDVLRIIAILAVILIHTTTRTLEVSSFNISSLPFTFFLNQFSRFAVFLFFFISGFGLERNYPFHVSYFSYVKKRLSKIAIPYLVWSIIYALFVYNGAKTGIFSLDFLWVLLTGEASYQLYFIPSLLLLYLLFPLMHTHYTALTKKAVFIPLFLFSLGILSIDYYMRPSSFFLPLRIAAFNFFPFLVGMIFSHNQQKVVRIVQKYFLQASVVSIVFMLGVFFEARTFYLHTHNYYTFYSQWRPSVLLYTFFLTLVLFTWIAHHSLPRKIIQSLSSKILFVFFIHIIFLELTWSLFSLPFVHQTKGNLLYQWWYDPLFFLMITLLSFGTASLAHKVPFLKKLLG